MPDCCGAEENQWEKHDVERHWVPCVVRCFIVGENPGDTRSQYFYEQPTSYATDGIVVRRALLRGLHHDGLIPEATLPGFRAGGFLFDHAIRCQLSSRIVGAERRRAMRYASTRAAAAVHLRSWLAQASVVWVMGHLASNAVAEATEEFPRQMRRISLPPYPSGLAPNSSFFLSEYLTWRYEGRALNLCEAFARFARSRGVFHGL